MKNTAHLKTELKKNAVVIVVSACLVVGIIGSIVFCNQPFMSLLFRPGILFAIAIIWGLYLGLTYRK